MYFQESRISIEFKDIKLRADLELVYRYKREEGL